MKTNFERGNLKVSKKLALDSVVLMVFHLLPLRFRK